MDLYNKFLWVFGSNLIVEFIFLDKSICIWNKREETDIVYWQRYYMECRHDQKQKKNNQEQVSQRKMERKIHITQRERIRNMGKPYLRNPN